MYAIVRRTVTTLRRVVVLVALIVLVLVGGQVEMAGAQATFWYVRMPRLFCA